MAGPVPLLLAGGAALLLLGGGKKPRKSKKTLAGQPCDATTESPKGLVCKDGILHPVVIDESMLEKDEEPTGEEAGEFETKEEDVSLSEGEEASEVTMTAQEYVDPAQMCDEFLQEIYTAPTEAGEIPIKKVAVEQTVLPTMKQVMVGIHQNLGGAGVDAETVGPVMVEAALNELIPVCEWKYDHQEDEFTFSDGMSIESDIGKDVLFGLMQISVQLIEEYNQSQQEGKDEDLPQAGFQAHEVPPAQAGFQQGG